MKELKKGGTVIPILDRMPEILPQARFYWQAFQTLSSKRDVLGGKASPIRMTEILAYVEFMRLDNYQARNDLLQIITALDNAYMELSRALKPQGQNPSRQLPGGRR